MVLPGTTGALAPQMPLAMMDKTPYQQEQVPNRLRAAWRRKLRPVWQDYQWAIFGGLAIFTVMLGIAYLALELHRKTGPTPDYLSLCLTAVRSSGMLLTVYGTAKALALIFQRQIQFVRLKLTNNHVVVCGMGNKGSLFAKAFYENGYKVVAIENNAANSRLEQFRDLKMLMVTGDATTKEILHKARVHKARYLLAVCGTDGDNAKIAVMARGLVSDPENTKVLTCLVHITEPLLCNLLKEREIMGRSVPSFRMEFFNVFESGARQLLKEFPAFAETGGNSRPHLFIVGLGALGKSLTVHAATLWRIAADKSTKKLPITLVDKDAAQKKEYLELQYPQLNDSWDLTPITLDIDSPQFYQARFLRDGHGRCLVTNGYVCLDNDSRSLSAALALFQHLRHENVPVVVQMANDEGLATLLQGDDSNGGSFANLHSFGLYNRKCEIDLLLCGTHEILARAIHQDYLWTQKNMGLTPETNPLLVPWDELPENIKESNRRQADDVGKKLTTVHCDMEPLTNWDAELFEFTAEEIDIMAAMEHRRWLNERRNEGWTYAPGPKNLSRKTSPVLLEWEELPEDIKQYNRDTVRSLPVFLARAGFQIFRTGAAPAKKAKKRGK
jgi:hypothetical protein